VIRAGLARALKLFLGVSAVSAAVSLLIGLLGGSGAARAVSVGWYCVGAFTLMLGFVASSRGPTRTVDGGAWAPVSMRGRSLRWASRTEQEESISVSAVLVVLGFVLIALGVLVDPRHPLF
jgi:uncharacterized membrane protein